MKLQHAQWIAAALLVSALGMAHLRAQALQRPAAKKKTTAAKALPTAATAVWRGMSVTYVMKDGLPIYQGDIILDHLDNTPKLPGSIGSASIGVSYSSYLWPTVGVIHQVPYIVTSG